MISPFRILVATDIAARTAQTDYHGERQDRKGRGRKSQPAK